MSWRPAARLRRPCCPPSISRPRPPIAPIAPPPDGDRLGRVLTAAGRRGQRATSLSQFLSHSPPAAGVHQRPRAARPRRSGTLPVGGGSPLVAGWKPPGVGRILRRPLRSDRGRALAVAAVAAAAFVSVCLTCKPLAPLRMWTVAVVPGHRGHRPVCIEVRTLASRAPRSAPGSPRTSA
jgi:hypothetical protein